MEIKMCEITADEVIYALEKEKILTLATCAMNRVTIRPMSHVNNGLLVYFQTAADSLKMRQIRENPNVALCVGTYEIEGIASELGHPLADQNSFFVRLYKEKHIESYERYSAYAEETVIKVIIHKVRQWRYVDGEPALGEMEVK